MVAEFRMMGEISSRCATSSTLASTPAFDAIVQHAARLVHEDLPNTTRREFDLKTWPYKSKGGLTDGNRVKVAEIYSKATSVFEYGLGESTMIADHVGVPRYSGIDSDPVWIANTRKKVSNHFRFYLADIGETGAWGRPTIADLNKGPLDYMLAPLMAEPLSFDVYMVDGRWRLSCMLASFLHASARGRTESPIVMVHDCDTRPHYHQADHLLELEEVAENSGTRLCVFKRKPDTSDDQLVELWMKNYRLPN